MEELKIIDKNNKLEIFAKGTPKISNLTKQELKNFLSFLELEIKDYYKDLELKEPP